MTNAELYKALKSNRYIVVRNWLGIAVAVNCAIALKLELSKKRDIPMNNQSQIASFYPCTFQEYITKKIGYL